MWYTINNNQNEVIKIQFDVNKIKQWITIFITKMYDKNVVYNK